MTTGDMIRELRRLEEANKANFVGTGETNWASMCHDVANRLEELLKAQEPIAPEHTIDDDWMCGNCANGLVGYMKLEVDGIEIYRLSYCPNCGRAVKWE